MDVQSLRVYSNSPLTGDRFPPRAPLQFSSILESLKIIGAKTKSDSQIVEVLICSKTFPLLKKA